jgi:hypothetical protein
MFPTPQGSGQSLIGDLDTELGRAPLRSLVAPHRSAPSVFSVAPSSRPIGPPHRSARWLPRRAPSVRPIGFLGGSLVAPHRSAPSVSSVAPSLRPIDSLHRFPRWLPRRAPSVRPIGLLGGSLVAPHRSAPSVPSVAPSLRPIDPLHRSPRWLPRRAQSIRSLGVPPQVQLAPGVSRPHSSASLLFATRREVMGGLGLRRASARLLAELPVIWPAFRHLGAQVAGPPPPNALSCPAFSARRGELAAAAPSPRHRRQRRPVCVEHYG